ncbi:site-specific DNA-methyltransferase [Collinsella tanakaei]|uniref:site-specific DNA-methyltransferase n=1 Tax=Collinsella tanakaei TaxID=626935 RepID=UPI00195A8E73|nr:DNA methyltransferase [Collinsella tanakaei]MBM6779790.1 site-specific DNA-methyltransferase [Collinsella tanakaei]
MAQTTRAEVQRLVDKALKLGDAELAADIRAFAKQREFGLVFEHNRPERMRLYGKPVSVGDIVQVMAPRGEGETDENNACWKVEEMVDGTARLGGVEASCETREAEIEDLVAVAEYDEPIYAGLRETGRIERGGNKPYQIVINGENYHVLETLLFCCAGRVDCIYIDPPYNTRDNDWKYNNDYVNSGDQYQHSKWLAMMERRLKLAKQLLNPKDSVLIVTIDEKEYLRLGMLLEQVFTGAKCQMISSLINPSGTARGNEFYRTDEYIYVVRFGAAHPEPLQLGSEWITAKKKSTKQKLQWRTLRRRGSHDLRTEREHSFFPMYLSADGTKIVGPGEEVPLSQSRDEITPPEGQIIVWPLKPDGTEGRWQVGPNTIRKLMAKGYIKIGDSNKWGPVLSYLAAGEQKKVESGLYQIVGHAEDGSIITDDTDEDKSFIPGTQWRISSHNAREYGSSLVGALLPKRVFPYPKSLYAVEDSIRFFVASKPDALIVDFFAGSGTTAHAVMRLNHQDGGRRRCICVTNNEISAEEEKRLTKEGRRHGDPEWERLGICEYVTKPRIKAAITGLTPDDEPIKGDYKFVDEFPMADGLEENAVFYDLTYENPRLIEFGESFEAIAPLLWLRAGARGRCVEHECKGFKVSDCYAVLFTYAYANEFVEEVTSNPNIKCAYVVTDDEGRFANVAAQLPGRDVVRLYESYLQSFKIAAEGAVS